MIKRMRTEGAYIIDIARYIGCSERTVRRHLLEPEHLRRGSSRRRMRKLEPYIDFIYTRLNEHVWNAQVIFQEIKAQGYDGGTTVLREYIQPKRRLRHGRETVRFETQPGYQLQHDWGEVERGRPALQNQLRGQYAGLLTPLPCVRRALPGCGAHLRIAGAGVRLLRRQRENRTGL